MLGNWANISSGTRSVALVFALAATATPSFAHSFVVKIRAVGEDMPDVLVSAVQGFLIATAERDGHPDQDSDGHLGGLDVYIVPEPAAAATGNLALKRAPSDRADISVVIGPADRVGSVNAEAAADAVAMPPGTLPSERIWSEQANAAPDSFAARYRVAYGRPPDRWAAEGYDAARRIDLAVRPLGGIDDRAALSRALASSADGIIW